jgi:predicted nucleic acid-binding protein
MPIILAPPETPLVLDSDVFTHLRNNQKYVKEKIDEYVRATKQFPALTAITAFEANVGVQSEMAKNSLTDEQALIYQQRISSFIQRHTILPFEQKSAEIASYIYPRIPRKELRKDKGKEKNFWKDIFIVSIALAHNYGLATQNKRDMELIVNNLPDEYKYLRLSIWKP